jgi:hypothetical protein
MTRDDDLKSWSKRKLEREVLRLRGLLSQTLASGGEMIEYASGVTEDGKPFVRVTWGDESGSLDPDATRLMGLGFIEAAEAAENDAALMAVLTGSGFGVEQVMTMLVLMRENRANWKAEARGDEPPHPEATEALGDGP